MAIVKGRGSEVQNSSQIFSSRHSSHLMTRTNPSCTEPLHVSSSAVVHAPRSSARRCRYCRCHFSRQIVMRGLRAQQLRSPVYWTEPGTASVLTTAIRGPAHHDRYGSPMEENANRDHCNVSSVRVVPEGLARTGGFWPNLRPINSLLEKNNIIIRSLSLCMNIVFR